MKYTYIILNLLPFLLILQTHLIVYALNSSHFSLLAKRLNVSASKVPDLLAKGETLIKGNRLLIPLLNESIYGGSYIDLKATKIIINTVDDSKKKIITNNATIKPYLNFLSFVKVSNSLAKLNSNFKELTRLAKHYNVKNFVISNEYKKNNIVIYLNNSDKLNQEFIKNGKKLNPIIVDVSKTTKKVAFGSHNSSALESRAIGIELLGGSGLTQRGGYKHGFIDFYYAPWWAPDTILPENLIGSMTMRDINETDRGFILKETNNFDVKPFILNTVSPEFPELGIAGTMFADDSIVGLEGFIYENVIITDQLGLEGDSGAPVYVYTDVLSLGILKVNLIGMYSGSTHLNNWPFGLVTPVYKILKE
ncbi:11190_t:CDS:2, partial [Racocetra persica]